MAYTLQLLSNAMMEVY